MDTTGQEYDRTDHDAHKRIRVIEKRLELVAQAMKGEWKSKPEGEFEKAWADCDPPPPPSQPIDWSKFPDDPRYPRSRSLLGDK